MSGRITEADLIASIANALQYVSYYHPPDFIAAMASAYTREQSPSARAAIAQILVNSRMCATGHRPICQDTGTVNAFVEVGVQAQTDWARPLQEMIDDAVRQAWALETNPLRASVVVDPLDSRKNSGDNTPAMIQTQMVAGREVHVTVSAKGGGSENKTQFAVLNPSASVTDWVVERVAQMGAGWCPPGMLGIGVGGSVDKAMVMAKAALNEPIDITDLRARAADTHRGNAAGDPRPGKRPRYRRAMAGRDYHRARRQDRNLSHPCRLDARRPHSKLCGDAPRAIHPDRRWPGRVHPA